MKFVIEIGEAEKHVIEYEFNQLFGRLTIKVNNQAIKRKIRLFSEPIQETHFFVIDQRERLSIRIEKERKLLYGQVNRVFVNNRLFKRYEGV